MYKLRDYQQQLEDEIFRLWAIGIRSIMVQLPTGGGKTNTFGSITHKELENYGRVLVIAHREELIFQAKATIEKASGHTAGIIKSGHQPSPLFPLQVASIFTLTKYESMPPADLIIIDEAHHACSRSYTRVTEQYPNARILGFTATPCRGDGQGFKYLFQELICGPTTKELIDRGHLCQYKLFEAGKTIDTSDLKTNSEGEFNVEQLSKAVGAQIEPEDVVREWLNKASGKQTVVFAVDVEKSKAYAAAFCRDGIPAEHIDGKTEKDDRQEILRRFTSGETLVLCNCGIVSEGVDIPGIIAVQIVKPVASLSLWRQMVGRALRPAEGKDFAIIIDHSRQTARKKLGLPDDDVDWTLEPQSLDELGKKFFSVTCSDCGHVFKPLPHEIPKLICECPNCQTENTFKMGSGSEKEVEPKEVLVAGSDKERAIDLTVNPDHQLIIDKLFCDSDRHQHRKDWVYHQFMDVASEWLSDISMGTWRYLAQKLGYKTTWATKKYQEIEEQYRELTPVELKSLWENTVAVIEPYSTRALLRQHCYLVGFKNKHANLEVTSAPLLKMARARQDRIQDAFTKVIAFTPTVELRAREKIQEAIG